MNKQKDTGRISAADILLTAVSTLFLIAIKTFIAPCSPAEDGSYMACHWAGQAVTAMAVSLLIISALHLIFSDPKVKIGLSLSVIPVSALTIALPGGLIHLCMMPEMRCRAIMRPAVIVFAILMIAAAAANILLRKNAFKNSPD